MSLELLTLDHLRTWQRDEAPFEDTLDAELAATRDWESFGQLRIETTGLLVRVHGRVEDCHRPPVRPFVVRLLADRKPDLRWRQDDTGEYVLEPLWAVELLSDPTNGGEAATEPGAEVFLFARTYTAGRLTAGTVLEAA